jgi:hypothetical protein
MTQEYWMCHVSYRGHGSRGVLVDSLYLLLARPEVPPSSRLAAAIRKDITKWEVQHGASVS